MAAPPNGMAEARRIADTLDTQSALETIERVSRDVLEAVEATSKSQLATKPPQREAAVVPASPGTVGRCPSQSRGCRLSRRRSSGLSWMRAGVGARSILRR